MKDFIGRKLEINDDVVFVAIGYRHLVKGKIIKFTPQKVKIEYITNCNFSDGKRYILQDPTQLVKIINED